MTEQTTARRKRGAQPGNTNRLKHGFYSRQFRQVDLNDLDLLVGAASLQSEVAALRVSLRRLLETYAIEDAPDAEAAVNLLMAVGVTAARVANLIRTEAIIHGDAGSETSAALALALVQLAEEMPCLNNR